MCEKVGSVQNCRTHFLSFAHVILRLGVGSFVLGSLCSLATFLGLWVGLAVMGREREREVMIGAPVRRGLLTLELGSLAFRTQGTHFTESLGWSFIY